MWWCGASAMARGTERMVVADKLNELGNRPLAAWCPSNQKRSLMARHSAWAWQRRERQTYVVHRSARHPSLGALFLDCRLALGGIRQADAGAGGGTCDARDRDGCDRARPNSAQPSLLLGILRYPCAPNGLARCHPLLQAAKYCMCRGPSIPSRKCSRRSARPGTQPGARFSDEVLKT